MGELKNVIVGQSGGPTAVINSSLAGVFRTAKMNGAENIYGMRYGIQGLLEEKYVNMSDYIKSELEIELLKRTPSSYLGSCRYKLPGIHEDKEVYEKIFKRFEEFNIGYFIYIGGNDSAETAHIVSQMAKKHKFPLKCFHIPKTIDNDLRCNDHTPGYGSAARYVAMAFMGDNLDNVALGGVKINIVMGRHAGFLTAASALARQHDDDGPHLVYLPEVAFSMDKFLKDVAAVMKKFGRCVVAVSEGIADKSGKPIATLLGGTEKDSHGNVQLSGTGALGDMLAREIKAKLGIKRVRADTFGYIQRSFPGVPSYPDRADAFAVGETAVKVAVGGKFDSGSIAIVRLAGKKYKVKYECVPLKDVAGKTKTMPRCFINRAGNNVTQAFIDYATPLVGELPKMERLI